MATADIKINVYCKYFRKQIVLLDGVDKISWPLNSGEADLLLW